MKMKAKYKFFEPVYEHYDFLANQWRIFIPLLQNGKLTGILIGIRRED